MSYTPEKTPEELRVAREHVGRIARFVRHGGFDPEEWPAYRPGRGTYLVVGEDGGRTRIERAPPFTKERIDFWARRNGVDEDILEDFQMDGDGGSAKEEL